MDINTKFKLVQIRNKLNLNVEPWIDIPDDLLYLAFIPNGSGLDTTMLINKYQLKDNDILEFIGDAV